MWHVEDVGDVILIFFECNAIYVKDVEDVEDRSNTPKGCNAMYVEDGKRTYTHIFAHNFLNIQPIFNPEKVLESWDLELFNHTITYCVHWSMLKMSKIDQVHLRAVMLCMSQMSKMVFAAFMQHCIQSYSFCYSCLRCRRCPILWIIDQSLKIHRNMFLLITSLIFNGFSIQKKFWKAET